MFMVIGKVTVPFTLVKQNFTYEIYLAEGDLNNYVSVGQWKYFRGFKFFIWLFEKINISIL